MLKRLIIALLVIAYLTFVPYNIAHYLYARKHENAITYYLIGIAITAGVISALLVVYVILYTLIHWIVWGHTEFMDFEISSLFKS